MGGFVRVDPPQLPSSQREFPTQLGSVRCAGLLHFSGSAFSFNSPCPQNSKEFTAWSRLLDASAITVAVSGFSPEEERRGGRYS